MTVQNLTSTLTPMQSGMLFHHLTNGDSGVDVQQILMTFDEGVDRDRFQQAWRTTIDRHQVLRTFFDWTSADRPVQVVADQVEIPVADLDWSSSSEADQAEKLRDLLAADRVAGFDLAQAPLLRLTHVDLGGDRSHCLWTFHHILLDGRSFPIVIREVFSIYDRLMDGIDIEGIVAGLPDVRQFSQVVDFYQSADFSSSEEHWLQLLGDVESPTPLGLTRTQPTQPVASATAHQTVYLDDESVVKLNAIAAENRSTLNTLLQGAWALLLHKHTGEQSVTFANTRAGRYGIAGSDDMVGMLINTVPVRTRLDDNHTVADFMSLLREQHVDVRPHELTPLGMIQKWVGYSGDSPLMNSLFVFENYDLDSSLKQLGGRWANRTFTYKGQTNFPLTIMAYLDGHVMFRFEYDPAVYDNATIQLIAEQYLHLLRQLPGQFDQSAADVTYLPESVRDRLLDTFNKTIGVAVDVEGLDRPVTRLFADQVEANPTSVAVWHETDPTTYEDLDRQANQLANVLVAKGVTSGQLVGLCVGRSARTIVGMLGILKAGAAYVPLDPNFPRERLAHMVDDSGMTIMISEQAVLDQLPDQVGDIIQLDADADHIARYSSEPPTTTIDPEQVAYVIYTSGSTGKPKGVQVPHRALTNFLLSMQQQPGCVADDVLAAVTTISFDIAGLEIFLPLISGATVAMVPEDVAGDGRALARLLDSSNATILQATPATFRLLIESDWVGRDNLTMLCGGEPLPPLLAESLLPKGRALWNMYGPTETTIWSTIEKIEPGQPISIGRPIANTTAFVLDPSQRLLAPGAIGELCIGGDGVTHGYLNRPELTAEKFLANPFGDGLIYRTGDLARHWPDGRIECLGRTDHQVKIRGFRIELGDIEATTSQHAAVNDAVVVAHTNAVGTKQLIGYVTPSGKVTPSGDGTISVSDLRNFVRTKLPDYMVPVTFITLDTLPLTNNGKVNRLALPEPDGSRPDLGNAYAPPRTEAEQRIAQIWEEILLIQNPGVHDNFVDLGGDSLLIVRLLSRLREAFGADLAVHDLFAHRTIRSQAERLEVHGEPSPDSQPGSQANSQLGSQANSQSDSQAIAIVGMAGRFPKAHNLDQFWDNLINGVEGLRLLTDDELNEVEPNYAEMKQDPNYVPGTGILDDVDKFDAGFFGLKPMEARSLDPQQRLWLEACWETLENAGYAPSKYDGAIGVYGGSFMNSYLFYNLMKDRETIEGFVRLQAYDSFMNMINNERDYMPTRTSYLLDLKGPAINVQTACSTSLVAVSLACQSLLTGESDMALAGGVCVFLPQERGYMYQEGGMRSSDGHCRPFDAKASGTVFASGLGVVLLKRLDDAVRDGDNILAVVKGTALNNDGVEKASYTAPSIDGQADVITAAQERAGVDPSTITYVEAHGTATPLGDPIEVAALTKAFRREADQNQFCALGAVKSNIGHLDAAAGIAGLIKVVLSMQNEQIPPTLHFQNANPQINFESSPFYVVDEPTPWPRGDQPRRAGLSSFGVGGTNAHAVIEEAPESQLSGPSRSKQLIVLSAKSETALEQQATNLADHLATNGAPTAHSSGGADTHFVADVAYTLAVGRTDHPHRRIVVAGSGDEVVTSLRDPKAGVTGEAVNSDPLVVFMFPGQGSQFVDMGLELYRTEPVFTEAIDQCAEILRPLLDLDLRHVLYPSGDDRESADNQLKQTGLAQPAIFSVSYALAQTWLSWGVKPTTLVGHSVGEYVAACLAGVFTLDDALTVLAHRGRLMQGLPSGAMRAVRLSESDVSPFLGDGVTLAAVNAPSVSVVSGPHEAMSRFEGRLNDAGHETIVLHTSHAFHSEMMDPILDEFAQIVGRVTRNAPRLPIISTYTGEWIEPGQETMSDPDYWVQQLRQPVRFSRAVTTLQETPGRVLLEVGPGKSLSTAAQQHRNPEAQQTVVDSLGHPTAQRPALEAMLESLGRLWMADVNLDWNAFYGSQTRRRVPLPTYPFERKRHWVDPPPLENASPVAPGPVGADPVAPDQAAAVELTRLNGSANGSHPATVAAAAAMAGNGTADAEPAAAEQLVQQQLQLMRMQLAVWQQLGGSSEGDQRDSPELRNKLF